MLTDLQERPAVSADHALRGNEQTKARSQPAPSPVVASVAVLTAGRDKPYALGLASALLSRGQTFDFIGSDLVDCPELHGNPRVNYLNFRDQQADAGRLQKMTRVLVYYVRLITYALTAQPRIFHILWNNKFELFDRTFLMVYYKLLGKKIVFTAHNVNAGIRDGNDSFLNRLTLKFQYRLSDHIFVHTKAMMEELKSDFAVPDKKISVIPFGINNTVPNTVITPAEARRKIGISAHDKALLFFGHITPYKGLEYLVAAFIEISKKSPDYRLIIAGGVKECRDYWSRVQITIAASGVSDRIIQRIEFIPDEQTELYFKAADVLVLPYTHIFQSGVLFLGYSFGLPVIATDVGSLKEDIIGGKTGFVCPPKDSKALANAIERYFSSDPYRNPESRRQEIKEYANDRYSWSKVAVITANVYEKLFDNRTVRPKLAEV
jgi:D-inositol-3-phosphate glycosyltransferase